MLIVPCDYTSSQIPLQTYKPPGAHASNNLYTGYIHQRFTSCKHSRAAPTLRGADIRCCNHRCTVINYLNLSLLLVSLENTVYMYNRSKSNGDGLKTNNIGDFTSIFKLQIPNFSNEVPLALYVESPTLIKASVRSCFPLIA